MPIDNTDVLAFGAGAVLPAASGVQYVRDAKKVRKAVKKAPSIENTKLVKSSKVGDIFLQGASKGEVNYKKQIFGRKGGSLATRAARVKALVQDVEKKLGGGASLASGLGLRHGAVRVKGGVLHGGTVDYLTKAKHPLSGYIEAPLDNRNSTLKKAIKGAYSKELKDTQQAYKLTNSDMKAIKKHSRSKDIAKSKIKLSKNAKEAFGAHKNFFVNSKGYQGEAFKEFSNIRKDYLKTPEKYGKSSVSVPVSHKSKPLFLDKNKPFVTLTPKKALSASEGAVFNKAVLKGGAAPYSTSKGVRAGLKKIFLPSLKRKAGKAGPVCLTGQHCGTLPNEGARAVGRGVKGHNVLPTEQLLNENYKIKGVSQKPHLLKQMKSSFRTGAAVRTGATLAVGLGAVGVARKFFKKSEK